MPSNVLPFFVTAETGSAECPGFAALSTLLGNQLLIKMSKGISIKIPFRTNPKMPKCASERDVLLKISTILPKYSVFVGGFFLMLAC